MSCLRLPKKSQDFSILSTNSIKAVFVVRNISHEYFFPIKDFTPCPFMRGAIYISILRLGVIGRGDRFGVF